MVLILCSRFADSGGAFKLQIYSPYVLINKTGLPVSVRSRATRTSQPQDVAGETREGMNLVGQSSQSNTNLYPEILATSTPFCECGPGLAKIMLLTRPSAFFFDGSWTRVYLQGWGLWMVKGTPLTNDETII